MAASLPFLSSRRRVRAQPAEVCVTDFFTDFGYQEDGVLGIGMSGEVLLAVGKSDPSVAMAVKKFCLHGDSALSVEDRRTDKKRKKLYSNEMGILKRLQHRNIISVAYAVRCPTYLCIVMPAYKNGDLVDRIDTLDLSSIQRYFTQMAQAMAYLYNKKVFHADIKPDNFLIDDSDQPILTDFGLSKQLPSHDVRILVDFGTPAYRSPESIRKEWVDPYKCDCYALGGTLWAMLLKQTPVTDTNFLSELDTHQRDIPTAIMQIAKGLLDLDLRQRMSIAEVLEKL